MTKTVHRIIRSLIASVVLISFTTVQVLPQGWADSIPLGEGIQNQTPTTDPNANSEEASSDPDIPSNTTTDFLAAASGSGGASLSPASPEFPLPTGSIQINGGNQTTSNREVNLTLNAKPGILPGDFNHDGSVDTADYVIARKAGPAEYDVWRANFGATLPPIPGDYNRDGSVDAADYILARKAGQTEYDLWRANFGKTYAVTQMSFSTDGINWSNPEAYASSKTLILSGSDGTKTVYVKFFDGMGNESMVYSDSITLSSPPPTLPPTGSIVVNGGNEATSNREVTLTLQVKPGTLPGDFNGDGSVDAADYVIARKAGQAEYDLWRANFGKTLPPIPGDYNRDGSVDAADYVIARKAGQAEFDIWRANFGKTRTSGFQMSFSQDGVTWTTPEAYQTSKTLTISAGDGTKTIYVKFYDQTGQPSAICSQEITLDTVPPEVVLVSSTTAREANYSLITFVDGSVWVEDIVLTKGENTVTRTFRDPAGNETPVIWIINYIPGPVISITTDDGLLIHYLDGDPLSIEKPGEYKLIEPEFNGDILIGGFIKFEDDTVARYSNGKALWIGKKGGDTYYFDTEERLTKIIDRKGNETFFSYLAGGIVSAQNQEGTVLYDAQGKLLEVRKTNGDILTYDSGILSSITLGSCQTVQYTKVFNSMTKQTVVAVGSTTCSRSSEMPVSITYDENCVILAASQRTTQGIETIHFENGIPVSVTLSDGTEIIYSAVTDQLGMVSNLSVDYLGYIRGYDQTGRLNLLTTPEAQFEILGNQIKSITIVEEDGEFPKGTVIQYEEIDGIKRSIVTYPDSRVFIFEYDPLTQKDVLIQAKQIDGTIQRFKRDGTLESMTTIDGKFYEYQVTQEGPRAILKYWKLSDGRVLYFENGLDRIEFPDGRILKNIILNQEGRITQADEEIYDESHVLLYTNHYEQEKLTKRTFSGGSYVSFGDTGTPLSFTDQNQVTYQISYEEGQKIRLAGADEAFVYSQDGTLLSYEKEGITFEFDALGEINRLRTHFGEIESPLWNEEGKLIQGTVLLSNQTHYVIQNGLISEIHAPDGTNVFYDGNSIDQITKGNETVDFQYVQNGLQELENVLVERNMDGSISQDSLINFLLQSQYLNDQSYFFTSPLENLLASAQNDTKITALTQVPALRYIKQNIEGILPARWYSYSFYYNPAQPEMIEVLAPAPNPSLTEQDIGAMSPFTQFMGTYPYASGGATIFNLASVDPKPQDPHKLQYDLSPPGSFVSYYYVSYNTSDVDSGYPSGERTVDLSQVPSLTLGLRGNTGTEVMFEITDVNQNRYRVLLRGIDEMERFFKIELSRATGIDLTQIRSLALIMESDRQVIKQGTLEISFLSFESFDYFANILRAAPELGPEIGVELPHFQSISLEGWRFKFGEGNLVGRFVNYPTTGNYFNSASDSEVDFHFEGISGQWVLPEVKFTYDHPDTEAVEYGDISGLGQLVLGFEDKSHETEYFYLLLEDVWGNRQVFFNFQATTPDAPSFHLLNLDETAVDLKYVSSIRFLFNRSVMDTGTDFRVWLKGVPRETPIHYARPNVETDHIYLRPQEKMSVSLAQMNLNDYDFVNVSIKAPDNAADSRAKLTIGNSSYTTEALTPGWNHLMIPLSQFGTIEGDELQIEYLGNTQQGYFLDNIVFFRFKDNSVETLFPKLDVNESKLSDGHLKVWQEKDDFFSGLLPQLNVSPSQNLFSNLSAYLSVETEISYTDSGAIQQAKTLDGRTLVMADNRLDQVILPSGQILDYDYDELGNLESTILIESQGEGGDLGSASTQVPLQASYAYDRIREVRREDDSVLTYQYEFVSKDKLLLWMKGEGPMPEPENEPSGELIEIAVVTIPLGTEPETYETKRYIRDPNNPYQTGLLVSVEEPNGLITVYEYSEENEARLLAARTYYEGNLRSSSTYEYREVEGDLHSFVTDEEGTMSEYDSEQNLLYHTTADSYKYEHLLRDENYIVTNGAAYLDGELIQLETPDFTIAETRVNDQGILMDALLFYPDGHRTFFVNGLPYLSTRDVGEATFFDETKDAGTEPYETELAQFLLAQTRWAETSQTLPPDVVPEQVQVTRLISRETDEAYIRYEDGKIVEFISKLSGLHVTGDIATENRIQTGTVQLNGIDFTFKEGLHFIRTEGDGTATPFTPFNGDETYFKEIEHWESLKAQVSTFIREPNETGVSKKTDLGTAYYDDQGRMVEVHLRSEGATLRDLEFDDEGNLIAAKAQFQGFVTIEYREDLSVSFTAQDGSIKTLSYFDSGDLHYEAAKVDWNALRDEITPFLLDSSFVIETEKDDEGRITTIAKADGSVSLYESAKVDQVLGKDGRLLVDYEYDETDGMLILVTMVDARKRLEEDTVEARREIARQRVLALEKLARDKQKAIDDLTAKYNEQKAILLAQRAQLEQSMAQLEGINAKGKKAKQAKANAMNQAQGAMAQLNQALIDLDEKYAEGIETIVTEAQKVADQIEAETAAANTKVTESRTRYLNEILRQELNPILHDIYRNALGRDPSDAELESAMAEKEAGTFNPRTLKNELLQSEEYRSRLRQVLRIRNQVSSALQDYLEGDYSVSANLGLSEDEVISLSQDQIDQIVAWLNSHDLHFGHSAFLALETLLAEEGQNVPQEDLAVKAILIDILTGVITPFEEGELKLSLFALEKTALFYGVHLYPAGISYEELKAMVLAGKKVIVHIKGDHYSIVTGFETVVEKQVVFQDGRNVEIEVTVEKVKLLERNKGANGEEVIVVKEQFLESWIVEGGKGYVLTPVEVTQDKLLTTQEAKSVRGAFFFFIGFIIAAIIAVIQAVIAAVIAAVAAVIAAVSAVISAVVGAISGLLSAITQSLTFVAKGLQALGHFVFEGIRGVGQILFKGLQFVGSKLYQGFQTIGGALKDTAMNLGGKLWNGLVKIGTKLASGIHNMFTGQELGTLFSVKGGATSLKTSLIRNALGFGLNYAATKGLDSLGIRIPGLNLLSSFVTGGITGLLGGATGSFITSGLQSLILTGISELALHLDLPPPIASVFSLVASTITGAAFNPAITIPDALRNLAPKLISDLALSGIVALGNAIGLDPRISQLIGLPFSSIIGGLVGNLTGIGNVWNTIQNTFVNKGLQLGISFVADQLNLPPELKSFAVSALTSFISDLVSQSGGNGKGVLDRIFGNIAKFGSKIVGGISTVLSFGAKVVEGVGTLTKQGFAKAVDFFSGLFSRETQETLYQAGGGSIEQAVFSNAVISGGTARVSFGGSEIVWDQTKGELYVLEGNRSQTFVNPSTLGRGNFSFERLLYAEEISDGIYLNQTFEGNELKSVNISKDNLSLLEIRPFDDYTPLRFENLSFDDAQVTFGDSFTFSFKDGVVSTVRMENPEGNALQSFFDTIQNIGGSLAGFVTSGLQKVDDFLYDTLIGRSPGPENPDGWNLQRVQDETGIPVASQEGVMSASEFLENLQNAEFRSELKAKLGEEKFNILVSRENTEEIARLVSNAHGSEILVYIGSTDKLETFIQNYEADSPFTRKTFMQGGDHRAFVDAGGSAIGFSMDGHIVHQQRVGADGVHFHNLMDGIAFYHVDQYPPTSIQNIFLHGGEFSAFKFAEFKAELDKIMNREDG